MVVPRSQGTYRSMTRIPTRTANAAMALLTVALAFPLVGSQTIGVDICACSPSVYTFQLEFLLNCSMETVKDNPGVLDADCTVSGLRPEDNVTDLVPIKVSTVEILELGVDQQVIQSGFYDQGYFNGANISYTSITGRPDALNLTVDQIPRGLQLNIIGQNAKEEDILNYWIILFTNQCNAFPVFELGDMIGWTVFRGLDNPLGFFCPPASEPPVASPAPSASVITPTETPISSRPTPCVPKSAAPFTSSPPISTKTTEPSFYSPHSSKGSMGMRMTGKGKGGTRRLRELRVWNDDVLESPAPTACIEPEPPTPVSPSSKSKTKSSKQKNSAKGSAKKKDPSKSSPSKSKIHESKSSKMGSAKSKHKTKHSSSKGSSSSMKSKTKAKNKAKNVSPSSKSKAKLPAKSSSKITAPIGNPNAIVTASPSISPPVAPSAPSSNVQLPPSYPVAVPSASAVDAPSSGISNTPVQPTPKPTRFPTFEPTPIST